MDWPLNFRGKLLLFLSLHYYITLVVQAESSPPVADVEDLFKDEGFLRMSRGGEAFGRRPPPPPLILGPPHFSTQPPRVFPTNSAPASKERKPPPPRNNNDQSPGIGGGEKALGERNHTSSSSNNNEEEKPLLKDVNAVFSKVPNNNNNGGDNGGGDSDAHPLLGITPAAPGEAFDFNPILSNPAVTRILAGSSGRIPQWEPTLPDLHDLIPEVNYTVDHPRSSHQPAVTNTNANSYNHHPGGGTGKGIGVGQGSHNVNIKTPIFIPSPAKSSPTMFNMDQLTNNIAIPKHTLPNPSNLATSRSTIVDERRAEDNGEVGAVGEEGHYAPNSSNNHLDESRDPVGPYAYEDEESSNSNSDDSNKNFMGSGGTGEAQGKRGSWKGAEDSSTDIRDGNGPKYIVCDALCGAWKHQCKLMGILFSITSVLCLILSFVVLYSLHFSLRDFAPFSIILLFLFTASASRASILLAGWFCSPDSDSRPSWLPILSVLPSSFFVIPFLVALHLARFPFPFIKSYNTIPAYVILILSLGSVLLPLSLAVGANFYPTSHGPLTQGAWIAAHLMLILISLIYLFKFKPFYSKLSSERGSSGMTGSGGMNGGGNCASTLGAGPPGNGMTNGGLCSNMSTLKKRGFVVKWGCLQARAMFGAALLALALSVMIIISVSMSRGECEKASTWTGWVLSLCARMLEFAIVILLLVVTIFSVDVRFISRLTRVSINKTNVGLINGDIYPTMVSSNTAVQRCIPMYSSNARADVMMLGPTESRSSLRGKTFGERALPGERLGEYRSSVGRGLPLRLGNNPPTHSLPGTPVDGFPQGLKLPEPAPASLLVTKVVFGTPAVSSQVSHSHQHENPLHCTGKDESNNIYASLESVKIAPFVTPGSSTGSNHSGSDRVLLSAPRDYIYSISRDLTKTIDSIYDASRPRGNNLAHPVECPPLAHTIDQIGSIPNLNGSRGPLPPHFNFHPHTLHHGHNGGGGLAPGRTDLARTIDRIRYAAATGPPAPLNHHPPPHPGRNFVLQLTNANSSGPGQNHNIPGMAANQPPPYCSSESSHDVTPDSGIVSDIHSKSGRMDVSENAYSRDYNNKRSSIEDVRRLPHLPLGKHNRAGGHTPLYDRTPTSPSTTVSTPSSMHPSNASPMYLANNSSNNSSNNNNPQNHHIVGRVEHLLNQTEHILSRTESLDSNSHSAGIQRLLSHKEQLEHVERLLAQAEYAIWLEKRTAQVSHGQPEHYGYAGNGPILIPPGFPSGNSSLGQKDESTSNPSLNTANSSKKLSKSLEEESVV